MGIAVIPVPSSGGKTAYRTTLTSGTSWTVPAGANYVNVTLVGGGGGGAGVTYHRIGPGRDGSGGSVISSTLATTPGASISYSIGAGGSGGAPGSNGGAGGSTTFTGATTATGGSGGSTMGTTGNAGANHQSGGNGGFGGLSGGSDAAGGVGGAGKIDIEYWV